MKVLQAPKIKNPAPKKYQKPFFKITFTPDFDLFPEDEWSPLLLDLLWTRAYDIAATTPRNIKITVIQDGVKFVIPVKTFKDYIPLFFPEETETTTTMGTFTNERWSVAVLKNPGLPMPFVSFVNNIQTYQGGEHVRYLYQQITKFLTPKIPSLKVNQVANHVFLFVSAVIEDPSFNSQSKEALKTIPKNFGSTCVLPVQRCLSVLLRNGVLTALKDEVSLKDLKKQNQELTSKNKGLTDIPHFQDAKHAGKRQRDKTTLFIVEGVSALKLAEVGIDLLGHDYYGALALKGKIINASNAVSKIVKNAEFQRLCRVIGLELGKVIPRSDLRYHRLVLLTDQDLDGFHIQGLFLYLFRIFWPHLLAEPGFLNAMITPIVVVDRKRKKEPPQPFYTLQDFEHYQQQNPTLKPEHVKYYKGLGTSTVAEGKVYFRNLQRLLRNFEPIDEKGVAALDLAFDPKQSQARKTWLQDYDATRYLKYAKLQSLRYQDFIHCGLKHFSWYSMERSIPQVVDGLTPAQRKCLHTFLAKKIVTDTKVCRVGALVSEFTNHHHAQAGLSETIVKQAQTFVGKQNLNVFFPSGQFGCLSPDTEVWLLSQQVRRAAEIQVGDILVGPDGYGRTVLNLVQGVDEMFEIQASGFEPYRVNSQHILTLIHSTTRQIHDIPLPVYQSWSSEHQAQYRAYPNLATIEWKVPQRRYAFDFYVWGYSQKWAVNDFNRLSVLLSAFKSHSPYHSPLYWKSHLTKIPSLRPLTLTLFPRQQQLQFLAGLCDAYGYQERKNLYWSDQIWTDNNFYVKKLLGGLGLWYSPSDGLQGPALAEIPSLFFHPSFSWTRFLAILPPIQVRSLGRGQFVGWSLDGDERFLLRDFTVTHNSRTDGGKKFAADRYIFTRLNPITRFLYRPEDDRILPSQMDEGQPIEPQILAPIIPMLLANGVSNPSTAYVSRVPCYQPEQLIRWLRHKLTTDAWPSDEDDPLVPWYHGFTGEIRMTTKQTKTNQTVLVMSSWGRVTKVMPRNKKKQESKTITYLVTELPIRVWRDDYKQKLVRMQDAGQIKTFYEQHGDTKIQFEVVVPKTQAPPPDQEVAFFQLQADFDLQLNLFADGQVRTFESVRAIFHYYFEQRYHFYGQRKKAMLQYWQQEIPFLQARVLILEALLEQQLDLKNFKAEVDELLQRQGLADVNQERLWNMSLGSLKPKRLEVIRQEYTEAQRKVQYYQTIKLETWWLQDLDELEAQLPRFWQERGF